MIGALPTKFDLSALDTLVNTPTNINITKDDELDDLATDVKALKRLEKEGKEAKKEAEADFEQLRKQHQVALDDAKSKKKAAGEPYVKALQWVKTTQDQIRTHIADYQAKRAREVAEEEQRIKAMAEEAERKRQEAEQAKIEANKTGSNDKMLEAYKAEQEATKAQNELATAELTAPVQDIASTNVSKMHTVDFEVDDIMQVPDEFIDYLPNMEKIRNKILKAYPFLTSVDFSVNYDQCPDDLMYDVIKRDAVTAALRAGQGIAGIRKIKKEHIVIR